jgi:serine/threonine protein kinase
MSGAPARLCAVCGVVVPANFRYCPFCSSVIPPIPSEAERQRTALQAALGESIEIHERIGRGGYGMVYRATDHTVEGGRQVAVKVLHAALGESELMRERFLRGARVAALLAHAHILPVEAAGGDGSLCYLVMPFVEGESLAAVLLREGRLPPPEATRILREVAEALGVVHAAGYVHRDVKPQHILLRGRARRVLLIDFSLVCAVGPSLSTLPRPEEGVVVGTPAYMSPEQAEGRSDLDARSDLYALGVVGYQLLTGTLPFEGTAQQQLVAHRTRVSRNPSVRHQDIPADLADVVMRCLAKLPASRWTGAEELLAGLAAAEAPLPAAPPPGPPAPEPVPPPPAAPPVYQKSARPVRPAVRYLTVPPPPPDPVPAPPAPASPEPPPVVELLHHPALSRATPTTPAAGAAPPRGRNAALWAAGGVLVALLGYVALQGLRRGPALPVTLRDTAVVRTTAQPSFVADNPGYLTVIVLPGGRVFVDGADAGAAPLTRLALAPGLHRVRIERAGYRTDSVRVQVQPGVTVETRVALIPR